MEVVSYESFPTSNLYDGRKWMSGSWKPLKMDPGKGHGPDLVVARGQRHPAPWAHPAAAVPCPLTSLHLEGELVVLQQSLHAGAEVLLQDGLHGRAPPTQAEVEVPKPEDLIEAGGNVRWGTSGRKLREPPTPAVCLHPDSRSGHSPTPLEAGGRPGRPWGSGPGSHGVGGVSIAFWVHGVTTWGAWCQTSLLVGERLQTSGRLGSQGSKHSSPLNHPENEGKAAHQRQSGRGSCPAHSWAGRGPARSCCSPPAARPPSRLRLQGQQGGASPQAGF